MSRTTKHTKEQIERVKSLLVAHSVREVAEITGIPKSTVHWMGKLVTDKPSMGGPV